MPVKKPALKKQYYQKQKHHIRRKQLLFCVDSQQTSDDPPYVKLSDFRLAWSSIYCLRRIVKRKITFLCFCPNCKCFFTRSTDKVLIPIVPVFFLEFLAALAIGIQIHLPSGSDTSMMKTVFQRSIISILCAITFSQRSCMAGWTSRRLQILPGTGTQRFSSGRTAICRWSSSATQQR